MVIRVWLAVPDQHTALAGGWLMARRPSSRDPLLPCRRYCCCSVPWQTDDLTLQQHFCGFGPVEEATIMREKHTGKSRGFGFVTFSHTGAHGGRALSVRRQARHCAARRMQQNSPKTPREHRVGNCVCRGGGGGVRRRVSARPSPSLARPRPRNAP